MNKCKEPRMNNKSVLNEFGSERFKAPRKVSFECEKLADKKFDVSFLYAINE